MKKKVARTRAGAHRVRLPGFVVEHDVGLGDVIKRATSAIGIKPCGGCAASRGRAQSLVGFHRAPLTVALSSNEGTPWKQQPTLLCRATARHRKPGTPAAGRRLVPHMWKSRGHGFIYALGKIEARFPSQGVEKEFAQVAGRTPSKGKTDREMMQAVLSAPENRYLARQLCWVLTLQGLETYLLAPRDPVDLRPADPDGARHAATERSRRRHRAARRDRAARDVQWAHGADCHLRPDLLLRPRRADQGDSAPAEVPAKEFQSAAEELFDRIMQITDNAGATDEHRALNYLRGSLSGHLRQDRGGSLPRARRSAPWRSARRRSAPSGGSST